jgi:molybdenum cofactor guanylyltransferase
MLSVVILAGGQSRRMGQDKALIPIDKSGSQLMIQRVYDVARQVTDQCGDQCGDRIYIISSWGDRYRSVLPVDCSFITEQPLDGDYQGPLVALAQALAQVETEWILLLACDLPNLQRDVMRSWFEIVEQIDPSVKIAIPKNQKGWWEPLCGFYRCSCFESLQQFIETGGRSFQRWLADESIQELPVPDTAMLLNCNTPEDLTQIIYYNEGTGGTDGLKGSDTSCHSPSNYLSQLHSAITMMD